MIQFKKLTYASGQVLRPLFASSGTRICEYSYLTECCWANYLKTQLGEEEGYYFLSYHNKPAPVFRLPLGEDLNRGLDLLDNYLLENKLLLSLTYVPEEVKDSLLSRYPHLESTSFREEDDYIYNATDLAFFQGKNYATQRNHVSRFKRDNPGYQFKIAEKKDIKAIEESYLAFEKEQDVSYNPEREYEALSAFRLIRQIGQEGVLAAYLTDGKKIVAFEIGEIVGDTLIQDVEKATRQVDGSYSLIVQEFASYALTLGVKYINREDDAGDLGLRTSKLRYNPVCLLHKFQMKLNSSVDLIQTLPTLETTRLLLRPLKEKDIHLYGNLSRDEELNKWWGYDYKKDLNGEEANDNYFYKMVQDDFKKRDTYVFGLALKESDELIGEICLYNFTNEGEGEIGVRLFKEKQNQGYAYEGLLKIIDYAYHQLLLSSLYISAFKENLPSLRLIHRLKTAFLEDKDGREYYRICK
ncbi:MAG: GNAT family N-acetyltransferase [Bacilli bacterium]|jgi:RimJ/RimL family protein N-acetyltransferase|nr:GNAT family N-acetyltransferase [Bacilli bacterium]